jgi:hypothetical protein
MAAAALAMAEQVVAELRVRCETPPSMLREVAAEMAREMGAGLEKDGGSRVKMLLSYVDKLPTGFVLLNLSFLLCLYDDQRMILRPVACLVVLTITGWCKDLVQETVFCRKS